MDQLVGRERELGVLDGEAARARDGSCRVVLVSGEPGIGKTRLIDEAARCAEVHGATVLRGGASEAEGMPPYLPFLEAITGYVHAAPPERVRAELGPVAPTLVTIVPELSAVFGDLAPSYPVPPEQARLRLYAAVGELLAGIAATSPVVLALDDLQWADPASLDLLTYVATHQAGARLLILGAHRLGGPDRLAHLERMGVELHRRRLLRTLRVQPLAGPAIAELARRLLGGDVSSELARRLHEQSEGNPFFAEEFLRAWSEGGALRHAPDGWAIDRACAETLPLGVSDCIRQRLDALALPAREHLRTAAVIGRVFDVGLLAAVTDSDPLGLEDELLTAASAGLVRTEGPESFSFSHDKIRESLCADVSTMRRRRLHELIGHALEARDGRDRSRQLAALAFHFGRSEDRARGARYQREAAEQALRSHAPAEAVTHFESALNLLDGDDAGRGRLLLGLGEAAGLLGQEAPAIRAFEEAQRWHQTAGDLVGAAEATHALGMVRGELRALSSAQAEVDAALRLLEHGLPDDRAALARAYAWRAMQHALQGEWEDVNRLVRGAGPLVEAVATPEHASLSRQLRGFVAYQRGDAAEAVRELTTAVALSADGSTDAGARRAAVLGLTGLLGLAQLAAGQEQAALATLHELEGVLASTGSAPDNWSPGGARTLLALGWLVLGRPERALAHYPALLEMQGELHWFLVDRVLGMVDVATADWTAARAHLGMAATTARQEGLGPERAATRMALAELELARARTGGAIRAADYLHQARALFQELGMRGEERRAQARVRDVERLGSVLPGGLTPREVSVVQLVAAGRSNRDISRALSLSEKTVANHLTSIFTKLGVDNRAGAAAFTVRNGLS